MASSVTITRAEAADAEAILALQKLAYESEAQLYQNWNLPPLTQTLDSLREEFAEAVILKAVQGGRILGSVRARLEAGIAHVGRLIVAPEYQRRGIGSCLLDAIEAECVEAQKFCLFTGSKSAGNLRLYQRHGYRITREEVVSPAVTLCFLEKPARPPAQA